MLFLMYVVIRQEMGEGIGRYGILTQVSRLFNLF
jgi:hypothetical protein